ncbi:MAG: hypothetical protein KJ880_06875 [Candidatus Omnitrophica bacterium]|nr:hypothetical protein [Candidatus Omnitrophota bacterium]
MPIERSKIKDQRSKIQNLGFLVVIFYFLFFIFDFCFAAPCYGTRMPENHKVNMGVESYTLMKRRLGDNYGKIRSQQQFLDLSYGVFDWFSIDLKGGAGDIRSRPQTTLNVDYATGFAGGYGFRVRFLDKDKVKAVFCFQHISVHPYSEEVNGVRNRGILDDWQTSLLASYKFKMATPYIGTRWSRVDYIHKTGDDKKRKMSDRTRSIGLIVGTDIPINERIWVNLEGQFLDSSAACASVNYSF